MKTIEDVYREEINDLFIRGYSIETIALCMMLSEKYVRNCIRANEKNDDNCVNLSLEKYEEIERKIEQQEVDISCLESEIKRLTDIITKLGIPGKIIDRVGVDIPLSCYWQDDSQVDKRKYRIEFEVERSDIL